LLRPLVLYMQYALILASVTSVELPAALAYPLQALAWAWSPAVPGTLSIECILPHGCSSIPVGLQRMLFYLVVPAVLLVLMVAVHCIALAFSSNREAARTGFKQKIGACAMVVCFFFMPSILRSTFGWFACIPIDVPVAAPYAAGAVGSFWLHDPGQLCYQGYHRAWAFGLGLPLLVVVCGLLPASILWVVLHHRENHLPNSSTLHHGAFCRMWYKSSCCWWEVVVFGQTAVLTVVGVFGLKLGPLHQIIAFSGILAVMALLWHIAQPYVLPAAGVLHSIVCLFITNTANVVFLDYTTFQASGATAAAVGAGVLLINVVFVASVLWRVGRLWVARQAEEPARVSSTSRSRLKSLH
jgi:hypothetical protein